jgi:LPPG:FO 2-phospho-L-lactate transferase
MVVALAGGVGAARMLAGLIQVAQPESIVAIVNTGDDVSLHGLHVSPDLDTVTYTLAGAVNPETGWGLAGETWATMDALAGYGSGRLAWFRLGDRDLATHLYRTSRLQEGATLSQVTGEIADRWQVGVRVVPMSDDPVETRVTVAGGVEIGFQEYFVGRRHDVTVEKIRFAGIENARPSPGVIDAIDSADVVVICPSNPLVSIAPVLSVPGIEDAIAARRADVVAVSPIVAGHAIKGPADRLLAELGHEASAVGVARLYAPIAGTLVIDETDAGLAKAVEAEGLGCVVAPTIMRGPAEAAALARAVLGAPGLATREAAW